MSRYYGMAVSISNFDPTKRRPIRKAAKSIWPFTGWDTDDTGAIRSYGKSQLFGGESEEQFTERLTVAIWKANGGYCEVVVDATYLESLPYDTHSLNEDDYKRLMENPNGNENDNADSRRSV
jgi:hypothetical protein